MSKILNYLLFFISLIFLIFTIFKSEVYWGGINRFSYLPHYFIFLSTIILSLKINSFKKDIQIIILTSIYTIILSSLSFEGYIHLKQNKQVSPKKNLTLEFLYNEKKKINDDISIVSTAFFFDKSLTQDLFPLSGKSLSETIHCKESDYYSIYFSDRYGFNNPDHEWDKDDINYLLIGDSYVHGACVNRPNDIGSVLRKLSGKSVLNLGYDGNGPLLEYATLREYFKKGSKNLLWFYYEQNDLDDLAKELQNKILKEYLNDDNFSQNLRSKQNKINEIQKQFAENHYSFENTDNTVNSFDIFKFIKLTKTRSMLSQNVNIYKFANKKKPQKDFIEILKKVSLFAKKNNINLYFIYLPTFERYNNNLNFNKSDVIELIRELEINFIDIDLEVFQKQIDPKKLYVNSETNHYNEYGYFLVTKKIYEIINNENK